MKKTKKYKFSNYYIHPYHIWTDSKRQKFSDHAIMDIQSIEMKVKCNEKNQLDHNSHRGRTYARRPALSIRHDH